MAKLCLTLRPHELHHARLPCPSLSPPVAQTHVHWVNDAIQPSHPLLLPSPLVLNLSQHLGLFQWVGSSHQVVKILELQLRYRWSSNTDGSRHTKRCSASLVFREMQIKTTIRCHFTPVQKAIIKRTKNNKFWWGCGEKRTPLYCWWECRFMQLLWKTVWRSLKKLKIKLKNDSAFPLLDIYLKKIKTLICKDISFVFYVEQYNLESERKC